MFQKLLILALSRAATKQGTTGATLLIAPLLASGVKRGGARGLMKTAILGVVANYLFARYTGSATKRSRR